MELLFIQGGFRWKFDADGNVYTDVKSRFNCYDVEKSKYIFLPDIYCPIENN